VSRYIHLNAPKAGIVERPEDYRWSNYADLVEGRKNLIATGGTILEYFGNEAEIQRLRYRQFVEDDLQKAEWVSHQTLLKMRTWGMIPGLAPGRPLIAPSK
jgi:hypothetical protein